MSVNPPTGNPWVDIGVAVVTQLLPSLTGSKDTDLNQRQRRVFESAGGNVIGASEGAPRGSPRYEWQGERVSKKEAKAILRSIQAGAIPRTPAGPSPADRPPNQASSFPLPWPLPISIPGRVMTNIPPWLKKILIANPGLGIASVLLWPIEAGRGSDLRDIYGNPKPKGAPGRRGRRRRRAAPGPGRGDPWRPRPRPRPGSSAGGAGVRGLPGTGGAAAVIRRPRTTTAPPVVISGVNMPPRPRSLPPAVKIKVGKIAAPAVPRVPSTVQSRVQSVISNPLVQKALGAAGAAALASVLSPSVPKMGRLTLPGQSPSPWPATNPLTAAYPGALTSSRAWAAPQTAAQEQDCSCRPKRKKSSKKPCKNPVTSRRSFERDGARFVTTTKELKCPGSSRKKRRSRPAQ